MYKNKIDQDQMAMIIADWLDGELTTCEGIDGCTSNCPLNKKLDLGITICHMLEIMAEKLQEVEGE